MKLPFRAIDTPVFLFFIFIWGTVVPELKISQDIPFTVEYFPI